MFTAEELVFIGNLINAAIPTAVQNAVDVQNVHVILTKIGQAVQEASQPVEDTDESDVSADS